MTRPFSDLIEQKRILVCVGSGGVGKTTTAAALALRAAQAGKKTLVLTIDPARRLANSLGLATLGHEVQRVPPELLEKVGGASGELHAMMLDQKRAFDEVVQSHGSDPDAIKRVLENPVYLQISSSLSGSQEYAALAKLHEFDKSGEYDLIVVDTPPTEHALDFLDAPQKLTEAIDSPAVEWFRKLYGGGSSRWSLVGKSGTYVIKRLAKFVGSQFIDDLAVFFTEFNDILGGFRARAEKTFALLREDRVGFVLVASPEPMAIREALFFYNRLVDSSMPVGGFIVNRVHPSYPIEDGDGAFDAAAALADVPEVAALGMAGTTIRMAGDKMIACYDELEELATADAGQIERIRSAKGAPALVTVPLLSRDIHEIEMLNKLAKRVAGPAE